MPFKRGRWGKDEIQFMTDNAGKLPLADIAAQLNRDADTVKNWIQENLAVDVSQDHPVELAETAIRNALRSSPEWEELKQQFLPAELLAFERKYSKLMNQFKGDVWATEETQIFLLIKLELLMDRNMKGRQRAIQDIERLEKEVEELSEEIAGLRSREQNVDTQRDRMTNLERQLTASREAEASKTNEYVKLSEKHAALMREMKATRDQRITRIENSKQSVLSLLKALQEEDMRRAEGEDLELIRAATEKERERLSESHKYVDDNYDQPLLTPENA